MVRQRGMTSCSCFMSNHIYLAHEDFALLEWEVPFDFPPDWATNATVAVKIVDDRGIESRKVTRLQVGVTT